MYVQVPSMLSPNTNYPSQVHTHDELLLELLLDLLEDDDDDLDDDELDDELDELEDELLLLEEEDLRTRAAAVMLHGMQTCCVYKHGMALLLCHIIWDVSFSRKCCMTHKHRHIIVL